MTISLLEGRGRRGTVGSLKIPPRETFGFTNEDAHNKMTISLLEGRDLKGTVGSLNDR